MRPQRPRVPLLLAFLGLAVVASMQETAAAGGQAAGPARTGRARRSNEEIARIAMPSVITIQTPSGTGSGVIVDSSGIIVTNLHVVRGDTHVSVRLANGDIYDDVSVVDVDERKDLVVLKIKAFGLTAASIANSDLVQVGQSVVVIGSPRGLDQSVSTGIVSAIRDSGEGYRQFQTSAAASPGSSGGGMFNEFAELVGIVSSKVTNAENVNFALPSNYARGLIRTESRMSLADLAKQYPSSNVPSSSSPSTVARASATTAASLLRLLEQSGLNYEKAAEDIWTVTYRGDNRPAVVVSVSVYGDLVLSQSTAVEKPALTQSLIEKLLRLNFDKDLVKAAIDPDGDLVSLNETEIDALDGPRLKRIVMEVALLADETAGFITSNSGSTVQPNLSTASSLSTPRDRRLESLNLLSGRATLQFDATAWRETPSTETGTNNFSHIDGDVYFKVIAERIEIPFDKMPEVVLGNARSTDRNAKIVRQGYRTVNGVRMLWLEMDVTASGVSFSFLVHAYSGPIGTIQLTGYTARNLMAQYRDTIERLVSGFQVGSVAVTPSTVALTPNESAAVANLRTINTAEVTYLSSSGGNYGTIPTLVRVGLLDSRFGGTISGYTYSVVTQGSDYVATATPTSLLNTGRYQLYSTPEGIVRYSKDANLSPAGQAGKPVL